MTSAREASVEWVARTLIEELRETAPHANQHAENLVAIAEEFEIKIEDLVRWIHLPAPRKQWTAAEFRRFAQSLATVRRDLELKGDDHEWRKVCPSCAAHVAHYVGGVWRCPGCGRVN